MQKTMSKKWQVSAVAASLLCLFLSGCAATLGKAEKTAVVSQQVYTAVKTETVRQISVIVEKDKNGTITQGDRDQLRLLNELRKLLDKYADAHNAYVASLKVWEASAKKPADTDDLGTKMLELIQNIQELAKRLNIRIR